MSLKFKGEITHKLNSSTRQEQQRPNGCERVKRWVKLKHRILVCFSPGDGRRVSLNILQVTSQSQIQLGAAVQEKQHTVEGINFLEKDAKQEAPGQGCLQWNDRVLGSTLLP